MNPVEKNDIPERFRRPYSEADFDGYRAAPLLIVGGGARKSLAKRQDAMAEKFATASYGELYDDIKPSVVRFVARSITTRMQQREGLNSISYLRRLNHTPEYSQSSDVPKALARRAVADARFGRGTPLQNHVARSVLGMGSIELANLTIVGDFRKGLEQPMWDDMSELVGRDATPQPEQMYGIKVLGFDRDIHRSAHVGAMRIGMKRVVGEFEDGTVAKARTSAIINTSPGSGFDQSIVRKFREVTSSEESKRDYSTIEALPEFQQAVRWLVGSQLNSGIVLARNETVYEMNSDALHAIAQLRHFDRAA